METDRATTGLTFLGRSLLLVAFFLTGAASLTFQVIWTRLLLVSMGATATSMATVLGAFMGGMAIGGAVAGRRAFSRVDPIFAFACLEGWAGLYGLATPFLLSFLQRVGGGAQPFFAIALLLPATIAMGASLPVLSRAFGKASSPSAGHRASAQAVDVGRLYAANTAGATVGPLLSVFWLFPALGLAGSLHIASAADLLVFAVLIVSRKTLLTGAARAGTDTQEQAAGRPRILLIAALAVSGGTAMIYEVAWSRILTMVYGSSIYGVAIMLSTFLFGLASGSGLASVLLSRREKTASLVTLAWILGGSAATALVSLLVAGSLPSLLLKMYRAAPEHDSVLFVLQFILSALLVLPTTLCLGAMLPTAVGVESSSSVELGRKVSRLYTANLLGATAGAVLAAVLLVGSLGLESSVRLAIVVGLSSALLFRALASPIRPARLAVATASILLLAVIDPMKEPVDKGFGFYASLPSFVQYDGNELRELVDSHDLLYYRDGPTATVSVHQLYNLVMLQINGKTDASNAPPDMQTQLLLGHLPLLSVDARRVAVIGWGSGVTAGAVLRHPVEAVDAFEIEPAVVEASRFFEDVNGRPLTDRRLRLVIGDARTELGRAAERYHVIISEPSNPWISGVANLFTREFFEIAASRLTADGIICQWFHLYGISNEVARSLIATFHSVFPQTIVFSLHKNRDILILGSRRPIRISLSRFQDLFEDESTRKKLAEAELDYPFDVLIRLVLDSPGAAAYSRGAPLNTDDNMRIELAAPWTLYKDRVADIHSEMARFPISVLEHLSDYTSAAEVAFEEAASLYTAGRKHDALLACQRSLSLQRTFKGQKLLGQILISLDRVEEARTTLMNALDEGGGSDQDTRFVRALLRSVESSPVR